MSRFNLFANEDVFAQGLGIVMIRWLLACAALLCATPGSAVSAPSLAAYGQLPHISTMKLSPDGTKLAYVISENEKTRLSVQEVDGALLQTLSLNGTKIRWLEWAGDDHVLIFASVTLHLGYARSASNEMLTAASLDLRSHKVSALLTNSGAALGNVLAYLGSQADGAHQYAYLEGQQLSRFGGMVGLFKVDLDTGRVNVMDDSSSRVAGWVLDGQGQVIARPTYRWERNEWSLLAGAQGSRPVFSKVTPTAEIHVAGLGRTANTVLIEDETSDEDRAYEVALDASQKPQPPYLEILQL